MARRPRLNKVSQWEETVWLWLERQYEGEFIREFKFHHKRRWRLDFACPQERLAIEVQGLLWGGRQGGHQRPKGVERDCEKQAHAMMLGWRVLPIAPKHIRSGEAYTWIKNLMRR